MEGKNAKKAIVVSSGKNFAHKENFIPVKKFANYAICYANFP